MRDFLSRNQIPYQWIDIDADAPMRELVVSTAGDLTRLPVVFLTAHGDLPTGIGAMKRGALDFLTKPVDEETLLRTLAQAMEAHAQRSSQERERAGANERLARLSPREREVMELVLAGQLNKQIADRMEISIKTVKVHRSRVMEKMEVRSVAALVHLCELAGIVPATEAARR